MKKKRENPRCRILLFQLLLFLLLFLSSTIGYFLLTDLQDALYTDSYVKWTLTKTLYAVAKACREVIRVIYSQSGPRR